MEVGWKPGGQRTVTPGVPEIELIGVPFDGYGRSGHQAAASAALREAGLVEAFEGHRVHDSGDLVLPAGDSSRGGDTSLMNEAALLAVTEALNGSVAAALAGGRFPFVYGGDCSLLLGVITGMRDAAGAAGLVFVDGHEDTMPLDVSEDGEAANTEIGLLLGLTGGLLRGPLSARLPAVEASSLAMLGQRDREWRTRFNVGSLRDLGVWLRHVDEVAAEPAAGGREAVAHVLAHAKRWWLHVDLDVLDPAEFAAQGLPDVKDEPGGLTWAQLSQLVAAAVGEGDCAGASLVIYDPDQDPTRREAMQIVQLAAHMAAALA